MAPPTRRGGASFGELGYRSGSQDLETTGPAQPHPCTERRIILDGAPIDALELGHQRATVYADIEGMAEYVKRWPEKIV